VRNQVSIETESFARTLVRDDAKLRADLAHNQVYEDILDIHFPAADDVKMDGKCRVQIVPGDTLDCTYNLLSTTDCCNPLVLNFASDRVPGGGWMYHGDVQEEQCYKRSSYCLHTHRSMYPLFAKRTLAEIAALSKTTATVHPPPPPPRSMALDESTAAHAGSSSSRPGKEIADIGFPLTASSSSASAAAVAAEEYVYSEEALKIKAMREKKRADRNAKRQELQAKEEAKKVADDAKRVAAVDREKRACVSDTRHKAIYTPGVVVFRSSKETGYGFLKAKEQYRVSFVAVAAVRNPRLYNDDTYASLYDEAIMRAKIDAVFAIGAIHKHDSLILGPIGCGAFGNPPHVIANMFADSIAKYGMHFKRIVFAIFDSRNDGNLAVFQRVFRARHLV